MGFSIYVNYNLKNITIFINFPTFSVLTAIFNPLFLFFVTFINGVLSNTICTLCIIIYISYPFVHFYFSDHTYIWYSNFYIYNPNLWCFKFKFKIKYACISLGIKHFLIFIKITIIHSRYPTCNINIIPLSIIYWIWH